MCPCPECDARLLRKDLDAHVKLEHISSAEKQLQLLWRENTRLAALSESELRHAAGSPTSWVFNWQAEGWGADTFNHAEEHDFGRGFQGSCDVIGGGIPDGCFLGFNFSSEAECRFHATFSILDKYDKTLCQVESTTPMVFFPLTAEQRTQSVRADGSVRMRTEVCLFMD